MVDAGLLGEVELCLPRMAWRRAERPKIALAVFSAIDQRDDMVQLPLARLKLASDRRP